MKMKTEKRSRNTKETTPKVVEKQENVRRCESINEIKKTNKKGQKMETKYKVEVTVDGEIVKLLATQEQLDSMDRQGLIWEHITDEEIDTTVLKETKQDEMYVYDGREFKITPKGFIYELIDNKYKRSSRTTFNEAMRQDPSNFFTENTQERENNAWLNYKERFASFGLTKEDVADEYGKAIYLEPSYNSSEGTIYYGRYLVKEDGHFSLISEMINFKNEINIVEERNINPYMYTLAIDSEFKADKTNFKYLPSLSFETKDGKFIKVYKYNFFGLDVGCMVIDNKVIKYKPLPNEESKVSALKQARIDSKRRRQEALDEIQIKQCSQEETVRNADKEQPSNYGGFSHGNKYLDRDEA